jgi:peptide/nickel transport system permease protein
VGKYVLARATVLLLTVVIAVYLTILVANLGGYVDEAVKADIDYALGMSMRDRTELTGDEKVEIFEQMKEAAYDAAGLNQPFILRCLRWLGRGLTLDWGRTNIDSALGWSQRERPVRVVILENLPRTLLVFGTANLALFFVTIALALPLSRNHGGWSDRLVTALSPLSSAPAWVYGVILNVFSLRVVGNAFGGGAFDAWPDQFRFSYLPLLLKHMALPILAIFLSGLFHGIYAWRTLFLLHAREDHVEMAEAKGLPPRMLQRRYILRPLLPSLVTSFALLFVSLWQEVIILEQFFNVAGVGRLFFRTLSRFGRPQTPEMVALVVTFAYLLAITVFLLDIIYAIVDPRVRVGGKSRAARSTRKKRGLPFWPPGKLLRRFNALGSKARRKRTTSRSGGPGWRDPGVMTGREALEEVLGGFASAEQVRADWLFSPGSGRTIKVDRLYPELGLAVRFTAGDTAPGEVGASTRRRDGFTLIALVPDRPVSDATLLSIRRALSRAARRIATRRGSHRQKVSLMPRIAAAKSACTQILTAVGADGSPARQATPRPAGKVGLRRMQHGLASFLKRLSRRPSAAVGLAIILVLMIVSLCTVIVLPYDQMITLWRESDDLWARNPASAPPAWINVFKKDDLPTTVRMKTKGKAAPSPLGLTTVEVVEKRVKQVSEDVTEVAVSFPYRFEYEEFPQDLSVYVDPTFEEKRPLVTLTWLTPDGREIDVASAQTSGSYAYHLSLDEVLPRKTGRNRPIHAILADPAIEEPTPLQGAYELRVKAFVFEEDADVEVEFVMYGRAHGLAGTDGRRRDLLVPLMWGMPVALAFGVLAAVGTSISSMVIAGIGTWFGGWVDALVQRVTEVNMILPFLPVSIMVYTLYSKSFWAILGVTVLLSIFGNAVKKYRAIFLQVREAPYVEAAKSYGAGDWRIIFRYLIPRIVPVLVPEVIMLVPSYVFLEATLAFLGMSDPVLPTWGKLIVEGLSHGIHAGHYHLFLEPLALLFLVAFAFVLLGTALERIFHPRLRKM